MRTGRFPLEPGGTSKQRAGPPHRGTDKKTFSGVERTDNHPVETFLQQIGTPNVAKAPCPRFKEWTNNGNGLEFTLSTVVRTVPPNIVFDPFNFEREPLHRLATGPIRNRSRTRRRLQSRPALVATSDCFTRGHTNESTALAIVLGKLKDFH